MELWVRAWEVYWTGFNVKRIVIELILVRILLIDI